MFSLSSTEHYYLCSVSIDMRKGFDSLCGVVRDYMGRDPLSGEVFIFYNSSRTRLKLLHWERGGLVIYHKRLEQGSLTLPEIDKSTGSYHLNWCDLALMVEGISLTDVKRRKRYNLLQKSA